MVESAGSPYVLPSAVGTVDHYLITDLQRDHNVIDVIKNFLFIIISYVNVESFL